MAHSIVEHEAEKAYREKSSSSPVFITPRVTRAISKLPQPRILNHSSRRLFFTTSNKPTQAMKRVELKSVRVTWRQCNTRDTVGGIMSKLSGNRPRAKNKNNHDWSP